jgi:hypothetical protein
MALPRAAATSKVTFPPLSASDSSTTETSHARLRRRHQDVGDRSHSSLLLGGRTVAMMVKKIYQARVA